MNQAYFSKNTTELESSTELYLHEQNLHSIPKSFRSILLLTSNFMRMKIFMFLPLLLFILLSAGFVNAQKIEPTHTTTDKKGIALRPNSRDYGANQRDNNYQRVENRRDGTLYLKKRPVLKQDSKLQPKKKVNVKKNQNFQKRKMIRRHRPL